MSQTVGYSKQQQQQKIARNCVQHNKCVFRVELDESQSKCVESLHSDRRFFFLASYYVTHCSVNMFKVPFIFLFYFSYLSLYYCIPFLKSGDFASGDMTVSFRVWLSGRDDFRREWYNSTYCVWVKIIYLLRTM